MSKRNLARRAVFFAISHALDEMKTYALADAACSNNVSTRLAVGLKRISASHCATGHALAYIKGLRKFLYSSL